VEQITNALQGENTEAVAKKASLHQAEVATKVEAESIPYHKEESLKPSEE